MIHQEFFNVYHCWNIIKCMENVIPYSFRGIHIHFGNQYLGRSGEYHQFIRGKSQWAIFRKTPELTYKMRLTCDILSKRLRGNVSRADRIDCLSLSVWLSNTRHRNPSKMACIAWKRWNVYISPFQLWSLFMISCKYIHESSICVIPTLFCTCLKG